MSADITPETFCEFPYFLSMLRMERGASSTDVSNCEQLAHEYDRMVMMVLFPPARLSRSSLSSNTFNASA